jgi:CRP-like cAMP-binding protein
VPPAEAKLVVVGGRKGARILSLPSSAVDELRAAAPWVVQDLEPLSDDLHVVAGAIRGPIGKRLDDALLGAILSRADTMRLPPGATVVKQGELVRALVIVGAGNLSLRSSDDAEAKETGSIEQGDVLFPSELLQRTKAPSTVRAGENGAVVLVATRAATEELMMTYPPLLDILSQT